MTLVSLLLQWPTSQAYAACAPAAGAGTPPSGTTVTCTGTTTAQNAPNGYGDGTQTGLTINVVGGASVVGGAGGAGANGGDGFRVGSGNTINSASTTGGMGGAAAAGGVIGGDGGFGGAGVNIGSSATLTASGTFTGGAGGTGGTATDIGGLGGFGGAGIRGGDNVAITVSGTVTGGAGANGGAATNAGSIGGDGGAGGDGIAVGSNAVVNNSAAVTGGTGGAGAAGGAISGFGLGGGNGISVDGNNSSIINSGSFTGGTAVAGSGGGGGSGVLLFGNGITVTNSKTITGGNGATAGGIGGNGGAGISADGDNTIVNNSGTVTGGNGAAGGTFSGPGGAAVLVFGKNNSTINNSGTMIGGNGVGTQPGAEAVFATNATVIDSGILTGGLAGDGVTRANAVTFFGGTNIIELQAGFNITGNVVAFSTADTFRLGGATNASFDVSRIGAAAQFRGFGVFQKTGNNTWTLTGTNANALAWTIIAGTLNVSATMAASTMTVGNGGTLAGNGTVGAVNVNGGGTFAPGPIGTVGTMTVTGNLAFQSGAMYLVQLSPTTASIANMGGTATLTGASVVPMQLPGLFAAHTYDILHATGGLGGTKFAGVSNANSNFAYSLSYSATDAFLSLSASLGTGLPLDQNQQSIASGLNAFFNAGGTLPPNFVALFGLTGGNLANALTLASGEVAADAQTGAFQQLTEFLGLTTDPSINGSGATGASMPAHSFAEENAYVAEKKSTKSTDASRAFAAYVKAPPLAPVYQPRWSVWAAGYGGYNKTQGDPVVGSNDVVTRTGGGAAGADYHFSPNALVGFALAGGGTSWGLAQGLGTGEADVFQAGLYGKGYIGPAYIAASIAFADNWMRTNRTGPFGDQLQARFNGQNYGGRLESGYRFAAWPAFGITPYAAIQAQSFHTPAYSEADLTFGGFGLSFPSRNASDTRSEVGARFDATTALNNMPLTLRARLAWAHDWITNPSLNAVFESLPGAGFTVNGAAPAKDRALASLGADLQVAQNWKLSAKFDGEFASGSQTYAGTGTVRYSW